MLFQKSKSVKLLFYHTSLIFWKNDYLLLFYDFETHYRHEILSFLKERILLVVYLSVRRDQIAYSLGMENNGW